MMTNLAPNHKMGLPIPNPVMLAAGVVAYGECVPKGMDTASLGAVVVGPITRYSSGGALDARMAETVGGAVLNTGGQNRGVSAVVRKMARYWPRLGCPVIAHIADTLPGPASGTARRLADVDGLMGLEVAIPRTADEDAAWELVQAVTRRADLPVLAHLPVERAVWLAEAVVDAGAAALVVGRPALGRLAVGPSLSSGDAAWVEGDLHGPLAFAPMLAALAGVDRLKLGVPLVAAGGIHTLEQARQSLASGAVALQIDSAAWIEPGLPGRLVDSLHP